MLELIFKILVENELAVSKFGINMSRQNGSLSWLILAYETKIQDQKYRSRPRLMSIFINSLNFDWERI